MREAWLAAAYLASAVVPSSRTLPTPAAFAAFHAASAVWYACRWGRVQGTARKRVGWVRGGVRAARPRHCGRHLAFVVSSLAQFPLHNPSAALFPFVVAAVLGLPRTVSGHGMMWLQCVLVTVAVLFDGAVAVALGGTALALFGFGSLSACADARAFAATTLAHLCAAILAVGVFGWQHTPDLCAVCLTAVLCAEARVRAATSVCRPRRRVMWACRAAAAGSVCTLAFRALAMPRHVSTTALGVCVLCAPWFWDAHDGWRRRAVFPPRPPPLRVWGVTLLTLIAGATWGARWT